MSKTPGLGGSQTQRLDQIKAHQTPGLGFGSSVSARSFPQKVTGSQTPRLGQLKAVQTTGTCKNIYCTCLPGEKCPTVPTVPTLPWWLTMTPEEAMAKNAADAKATLEVLQNASTPEALVAKALKEAEKKAKKDPKEHGSSFSHLHALALAMLINDEAAAQGDNGWTSWVAEKSQTTKPEVPPEQPSLSPYEQWQASFGHPMVYSEHSGRYIMLLPGAKPIGKIFIQSSTTGKIVQMD